MFFGFVPNMFPISCEDQGLDLYGAGANFELEEC
jgi:hypothetical protein